MYLCWMDESIKGEDLSTEGVQFSEVQVIVLFLTSRRWGKEKGERGKGKGKAKPEPRHRLLTALPVHPVISIAYDIFSLSFVLPRFPSLGFSFLYFTGKHFPLRLQCRNTVAASPIGFASLSLSLSLSLTLCV
jgi:hypothetical protein